MRVNHTTTNNNTNDNSYNNYGGTVSKVSTVADFNKTVQKRDVKLTVAGIVDPE